MIILFYLPLFLLFAASFALGYLPVRLLGRWLARGMAMGNADTLAPLAGAAGTAAGFLWTGMGGLNRFVLASDHVQSVWMASGQSFLFELAQPVFSGGVCGIAVVLLNHLSPRWAERLSSMIPLAAFLVSIAAFLLWPAILGPFID